MSFSTLASRALPSAVTSTLCSPSLDLVALSNPTASTSTLPSGPAKVSLYRATGNVDLVWEWSEGAKPVTKGPFKGKGKSTSDVLLEGVAWSPNGTHLAIALSSPTTSTIVLLSIHTGLPVLPSLHTPLGSLKERSQINLISWHTLPIFSANLVSSAINLISLLPTLPPLDPIVSAIAATAASGVFGSAKNAALLKEREKLAGRALNLSESAPGFPGLLPEERNRLVERKDMDLLVIADRLGRVHLYLGDGTTLRLALLSRSESLLNTSIIVLQLPQTLSLFLKEVTALRELLQHCFKALQEARVLWDEARRIGTAWLGRLTDLSADHGVILPISAQMLGLLMTGRPNRALLDFLATKTNERGFTKWESATTAALEKLKTVGFMSVVPSVERVILLLDELRSWAIWPEQFKAFQLDPLALKTCVDLSSEIIQRATELERMALEEENCFLAFTAWIKYELEKVSHQDGSEIRPQAKFQPTTVARYIQSYLITSPITPLLAFGMGTESIAINTEVENVENWFESNSQPGVVPVEGTLSLRTMMKRMKEELRGQADATRFNSTLTSSPIKPPLLERPPRVDFNSNTTIEKKIMISESLPVLLHVLARRLGEMVGSAIGQEQDQVVKEVSLELGKGEGKVQQRLIEMEEMGKMMYYTWVTEEKFTIARFDNTTVRLETVVMKLKNATGSKMEVLDFDFLDDLELILLLKTEMGTTSDYSLATIEYGALDYATTPLIASTLTTSRIHNLDNRFPPQSFSLNNQTEQKSISILCAEGRKLEILSIAAKSEDFEMK